MWMSCDSRVQVNILSGGSNLFHEYPRLLDRSVHKAIIGWLCVRMGEALIWPDRLQFWPDNVRSLI